MNERLTTLQILRELDKAKRGITLPLVFCVLSSVALAANFAAYQEPSLALKRLAMIAFWPVIAAFLVSTFTLNEAVWHYHNVKRFEPRETPPRATDDLLNFDNQVAARADRLVINDDTPNVIPVLRYSLDRPHWEALAKELRKNQWQWKREVLRRSKVFTVNPPGIGISLMTGDTYNDITAEFVRCGLVQGYTNNWHLDMNSKLYFLQQAGLPLEFL